MSNGFDGIAELEAIGVRLGALAGGRIYPYILDDAKLPLNDKKTMVLPFLSYTAGQPIPYPGDKSLVGDIRKQIYTLPVTIHCHAGNPAALTPLYGDTLDLLLGFQPTGDACTPLETAGGFQLSFEANDIRPALYVRTLTFTTLINMATN